MFSGQMPRLCLVGARYAFAEKLACMFAWRVQTPCFHRGGFFHVEGGAGNFKKKARKIGRI